MTEEDDLFQLGTATEEKASWVLWGSKEGKDNQPKCVGHVWEHVTTLTSHFLGKKNEMLSYMWKISVFKTKKNKTKNIDFLGHLWRTK